MGSDHPQREHRAQKAAENFGGRASSFVSSLPPFLPLPGGLLPPFLPPLAPPFLMPLFLGSFLRSAELEFFIIACVLAM